MDVDAIRVEVFKATGMNIDKGDPFFAALVMLSSVASEIKRKNESALRDLQGTRQRILSDMAKAHEHNSATLTQMVADVKEQTGKLIGVHGALEEATKWRVDILLSPVLERTNKVIRELQAKDSMAVELVRKMQDTGATWARNASIAVMGVLLLTLGTAAGAFYIGNVLSRQDMDQRIKWLDTDDGKFALQLRDAGSLKALATCNAGPFENNWKIKNVKVCIPYPTDENMIGWKIQK